MHGVLGKGKQLSFGPTLEIGSADGALTMLQRYLGSAGHVHRGIPTHNAERQEYCFGWWFQLTGNI